MTKFSSNWPISTAGQSLLKPVLNVEDIMAKTVDISLL